MKVLAIGAHYDDIEIGCGGTLLKHIYKGDDVKFAITSSNEYRTGDVSIRHKEQEKSAKILGIDTTKILKFSYNKDSVHDIVGELDGLFPDIVFTQYEFDTHQDHKRASIIGQAVGRKRNITTFFYDSGSAYDFFPNIYSIIDWPAKFKLLKCYQSQIDCGAVNIDILKKKDAYLASLVSNDVNVYAEGLIVKKMIWWV
jgi:LmbE family N-acetylglucosaminyl deacetylase